MRYKVLGKTSCVDERVSYDIEINLVDGRLPTKEELIEVAKKLRSSKHKRTFICFYLPRMVVDAGAFATVHYTPELKARVMTFHLPEQYQQLVEVVE